MLFTPLITGLFLFFSKQSVKDAKRTGIISSGIVMLISFYMYSLFKTGEAGFQFVVSWDWINSIGASFTLGIDGLSLSLVLLTTILSFVTLIFVDEHTEKGKNFIALILLLQTTLTGVFVSLDFILFYLFWELVLIPMYFMILEWGGPNRRYAAMKFFIYTHVGSFLMLTGFIAMFFFKGSADGVYTLSIMEYLTFDFSKEFQLIVFPLLFLDLLSSFLWFHFIHGYRMLT
jgi:NADH-quinone oxidoreductase subunit M